MKIFKGQVEPASRYGDYPKPAETALAQQESLEAGGYLTDSHALRAGDKDRHDAMIAITKARQEGRLTEEMFHARLTHVEHATSQDDLRKLVRDLPSGHVRVVHSHGIDWYHHGLHACFAFLIALTVTLSVVIPTIVMSAYGLWNSPWALFPVFTIIGAIFAFVGNLMFWIDP